MRTIPTTLVRSDGHGILAELSPLGAYRLLGTPLWTLTDTVTDVVDMVGHQAEQVVDRLAETPGWKARWALLDDALAVRAAAGPRPAPQVAWAWQRLCRSTGGVPITRLAVEAGWTRRHLSTRFREQIGLTPKMAARVIRFQHALRLLRRSGHRAPLVSVAQAAGYSDQAHFSREFRSLAGTTPVELGAAWP